MCSQGFTVVTDVHSAVFLFQSSDCFEDCLQSRYCREKLMMLSYFPKHASDQIPYHKRNMRTQMLMSGIKSLFALKDIPLTKICYKERKVGTIYLFYIYVHKHNRILLLDGGSQDFDTLIRKVYIYKMLNIICL